MAIRVSDSVKIKVAPQNIQPRFFFGTSKRPRQNFLHLGMVLRGEKFCYAKRCKIVNLEGVFPDYLFYFFFRFCQRKYYPTRAWHLSAGSNKHILFIIFPKKFHMIGHMSIELFQWN